MAKSALVIICQVYFCLLSIVYMVLSAIAYNAFRSPKAEYQLLLDNWRGKPIIDIRISYANCTAQEETLNQYIWPGTHDGCNCIGSDSYPDEIMDEGRACNSSQSSNGCHSIYGLNERAFGLSPFMNTTNPLVSLCATRELNNSFYNNSPIADCPPNTLKCGDNTNYFWCSTDLKCPIFGIGFTQNKDTIPDGAEIASLGSNYYFWKTRSNPNQLPIVEFRIVEGPGVCMLNHDLAITPGRSDYILMNKYKSDCQRDPRFKVIYSMDEYSYYMQNNALDIPKTQDTYIVSPDYTWTFYGRNYMHWKQICRGQPFTDFKGQEDILSDIEYRLWAVMIISIVYIVFIPCYTVVWFFGFECFALTLIIEIVVQVMFWILDAYYVISSFSKIYNETVYFNDLLSQDCSDNVTQLTLTNLSNIIELQVYKFQLARVIFFFLNIFLNACVILFYICKGVFKKIKHYNFNVRQNQQYQQPQAVQQNQVEVAQQIQQGLNDEKIAQAGRFESPDPFKQLDQMPIAGKAPL